MSGMRVYELARELGVDSKDLLSFLRERGLDLKNHMSLVDEKAAGEARRRFSPSSRPAQAKAEQPARSKAAARAAGGANASRAGAGSSQSGARNSQGASGSTGGARGSRGGLTGDRKGSRSGRRQARRGGRGRSEAQEPARQRPERIVLPEKITVAELAEMLAIPAVALIKSLMKAGIMAAINQSIDFETAAQVAKSLGVAVERPQRPTADGRLLEDEDEADLVPRPPVVTVMGHVDHGKTTLLDTIRQTRVVEREAGGITQHIGAYQVTVGDRKITFLDTPGHEAFTSMRARGAQVTDVAVLVVAADDGVMPQTLEAISHAQAAEVPIVVAINKMDRSGADPERVKQQLAEHGLVPDEWGGDTVCVPISALKGEGIDELLEMILLVADMRELKANPNRPASGVIVEARLDRGRGPVATVLVQNGTLRLGDVVVAGPVAGKVRAMLNEWGEPMEEAGPATPVEVLGFQDVPEAGDLLEVVADEREARQRAEAIAAERQLPEAKGGVVTLSQLATRGQAEVKELNLVLKADVQGTLEAVRQSLERLSTDEVRVNVIHGAVGGISETDVTLAQASEAVVLGFNVRPDGAARRAAERAGVEIRTYTVIYQAIDDVKAALEGMLEPEMEEQVVGVAEVRQIFHVPGGTVGGCYVTEGEIRRGAKARLLRDGVVVHDGVIASLRRYKDDVRTVSQGYECGVGFEKFHDLKEGDVIEVYQVVAVPART
ncbi:translation initiation factor IF-2 [Limnochorda sp.]|uniref:translation initiation factor IF-2 n=1 Tax=Limnochorda sp. TaxID=1940279 RepID=UPI001D4EA3BB|nr:translation initiation factor IF-2 [Bacillota bacterium]MBO2518921.1 translation initiation factor IF-2 [Bacillota bacterium]